jgi:hypothetical protein
MKKWIARKLFDWAVRLDWDETVAGAKAVVLVDLTMKGWIEQREAPSPAPAPKKKVGRPLGAKDTRPRRSSKAPA